MDASQQKLTTSEPEIPELTYTIATTEDEKVDALRLVADTIAQQRQIASMAVIFHPACFAPFLGVFSALAYRGRNDIGTTLIFLTGIVVAYLAAIQYYTYHYLERAETFNWKAFITPPASSSAVTEKAGKKAQKEQQEQQPEQDTIMVARYGDKIIAALVLRLTKAKGSSSSSSKNSSKGGRAEIRAWATRLRYRNTGVGGDMLRDAVALARSTLGTAATIEFSDPHAHTVDTSKYFTAPFARSEKRARQALARAVKEAAVAADR